MSHTCLKHQLKILKAYSDSSLSENSEEKDNFYNEIREKACDESLTITVSPEKFCLPLTSRAKSTLVLKNKNNCTVCFNVSTNRSEHLEIEPRTGCIPPGAKVNITVRRPKRLPIARRNEYLIFKIKSCIYCDSSENNVIGSNHYHAIQEESITEKQKNINDVFSLDRRDVHSKHRYKLPFKRDESYELICRNETALKHSPKRDLSTTYPKLLQGHEKFHKCKYPNEFKLKNPKSSLHRSKIGYHSDSDTDEVTKTTALLKCNHFEKEENSKEYKLKDRCHKDFNMNNIHLCCCQFKDNNKTAGVICPNKKEHQQIKNCCLQKGIEVPSDYKQKTSNTFKEELCCHCICKFNTRALEEYSPKRNFQNDEYAVSKKRNRKKLIANKEFDKRETERKALEKVFQPKAHCKCCACLKNDQYLRKVKVFKKMKKKRQLQSNMNEKDQSGKPWLMRLSFYNNIMFIVVVILITTSLSLSFVFRKEIAALAIPLYFRHQNTFKFPLYCDKILSIFKT